jgi:hypothetical protein
MPMPTKTSETSDDPTNPEHSQKKLRDAFGGDPIDPGDWVLEIIAGVVNGEDDQHDKLAERWAAAFKAICPEPNTPKRILLDKIADAVQGNANEEATAWAKGEKAPTTLSQFNLSHLP